MTDTLLVAFTAVLALATLFLATKVLVHGADDTARRDLRAYVAIEPPVQLGLLSPEFPVWMRSNLVNYGKTPARDVRHIAVFKILPVPLPADVNFNYPDDLKDDTPFVLHPTQHRESTVQDVRTLTAADMETLRAGRALCVYGLVKYVDAFATEHFTTYCTYVPGNVVVAAREGKLTEEPRWLYGSRYNDAD